MEEEIKEYHLKIYGRVQGVHFRNFTRKHAEELGITGWVRNMEDGTVETLIQGSAEAVEEMKKQLEKGPVAARVDQVEQLKSDKTNIHHAFKIIRQEP